MRGIEDIFGTIVVASEETSQFDIVQMVKDNIKASKEFKKASISRLYAEKRLALIQKIVLIKTDNDELKAAGIARTLEQCLNSYKLAFRTDIDFVDDQHHFARQAEGSCGRYISHPCVRP